MKVIRMNEQKKNITKKEAAGSETRRQQLVDMRSKIRAGEGRVNRARKLISRSREIYFAVLDGGTGLPHYIWL